MKLKVIHVILIVIILLLIPISIIIYRIDKKSNASILNEENKSSKQVNFEEELESTGYISDAELTLEYLLRKSEANNYGTYRGNGELNGYKYYIYDFNQDNSLDCMFFMNDSIDFYTISKETNIAEKVCSINCNISPGMGVLNFYNIKNLEDGSNVLLLNNCGGDGLCYEYGELSKINISNDFNAQETKLASYICDTDKEEKLREKIRSDTSILEEDMERELYKAHSLIYTVNGKNATEEEYDKLINELQNNYELIYTNDLRKDLFNISQDEIKNANDLVSKNNITIEDINKSYYVIYDINNDGRMDCAFIKDTRCYILLNENGKVKIEKTLDLVFDVFKISIRKNNDTKINELYIDTGYASGDSGVSCLEKIEYSGKYKLVKLLERSDSTIEENDEIITNEYYYVLDSRSNKEEYDKSLNEINSKNEIVIEKEAENN